MSILNRRPHRNVAYFQSETSHNPSTTHTPSPNDRSGSSSTSSRSASVPRALPSTPTKIKSAKDGHARQKETILERPAMSGYDQTSPPHSAYNAENHDEFQVTRHSVDLQETYERLKAGDVAIRNILSIPGELKAVITENMTLTRRNKILEQQMKDIKSRCKCHLGSRLTNICAVESHAKLIVEKQKDEEDIELLCRQIRKLNSANAALEGRCQSLEERSKELTKHMAWKTENSETLENVNDELSNLNIAQRLKRLYDNEWTKLYRLLSRSLSRETPELEIISMLSSLIKVSYDECSKLGDSYLRTLFCLKENEPLPDRSNELMAPLRRACQSEFVRKRMRENILSTLQATDESNWLHGEDNTNDVNQNFNQRFRGFFETLIDCLWLVATVSSPRMILNFDVVGKRFSTVQNSWTQYTTKKPVVDLARDEGTIVLVVWPSVEIKGQSMFYIKGDAVVVTTGRTSRKVIESERQSRHHRHHTSTHDPHQMNDNDRKHIFI